MPNNILSVNVDAKTSKGTARGFLTGILYLAPAMESGREVCRYRSKGCTAACLYTAGRGGFNSVQRARKAKTDRFFRERDSFMADLVHSIQSLERKAEREGLTPVVRLNGTSDIPWERVPVKDSRKGSAPNVFELFPNVQFYDYTKYPLSKRSNLPRNYDLTFSFADGMDRDDILQAMALSRVAVVFSTPKGQELPTEWNGFPVVDADTTDLRFLEPKGVVAGLRAKGAARKDRSGFVIQLTVIN
jgi:hypothetical protein